MGVDTDLPRGCVEHAENAVNSLPLPTLLDWSINEFFFRATVCRQHSTTFWISDTVPSARVKYTPTWDFSGISEEGETMGGTGADSHPQLCI